MDEWWKIIATPLVGAAIGYVTNWIAVKMLFRPREEIRILGVRLPLTPGVIPRGKSRLARAVGRAVEQQLLTREVLEEVLLSDEKKEMVRSAAEGWLQDKKESEETLRQAADRTFSEEAVDDFVDTAEEAAADLIYNRILAMDVGRIVAEKVLETVKEKLGESMFGMMLGGTFVDPVVRQVEEKINECVEEYGRPVVEQMVAEESEKLQDKTVGEAAACLETYGVDPAEFVVKEYEKLIKDRLPQALDVMKLSEIVEERINAMDVMEVEELMLSIMKKELGAVINLGALIGLILGLFNVAILYI